MMTSEMARRSARGFTLIEILVVIGIIAILIGLLLPAVNKAMHGGDKAKAGATVKSLQTAWEGYYSEYGRWPVDNNRFVWDGGGSQIATEGTSTGIVSKANTIDLLAPNTLLLNSGNNLLQYYNPKGVLFFSYSGESEGEYRSLVDPWDHGYKFLFDLNGDGRVEIPGRPSPVYASVAVWSAGPDGADGTEEEQEDDITSWE